MKYKMIILSIILVGIFGTMIFSQIYEKNEKNNNDLNTNNDSSINTNYTNETNYTARDNTTIVPLERPPFIDEIEETGK